MSNYLLFDTSTPVCRIICVKEGIHHEYEWEAGRMLAKNLLGYIDEVLASSEMTYGDVTGIGVFRGPGSFTGLRIGMTVVNTVVSTLNIPVVGEMGDGWLAAAIKRLSDGSTDTIVLPEYGSDARITKPRK